MRPQYRQQGATLITALVMLIVLTLLVVSAIRASSVNLRVVGNMQLQQQNFHAAQQVSEAYISNDFTQNPVQSNVSVTINSVTYPAKVFVPTCYATTPLQVAQAPDGCRGSNKYDPNNTSQTDCSAQQWDVTTTVYDPTTNAQTTVHQGISSTVPKSTQ